MMLVAQKATHRSYWSAHSQRDQEAVRQRYLPWKRQISPYL